MAALAVEKALDPIYFNVAIFIDVRISYLFYLLNNVNINPHDILFLTATAKLFAFA